MVNDIFKNAEGYNDQTAGKAIVRYETKLPPQKKGEVWTISNPNLGDPGEWYVVMPQMNGWVTCLEVKSAITRPIRDRDKDSCIYLSVDEDEKRYVDTQNVWTKPGRYFIDKVQDIDPIVIDSIDMAIRRTLDLNPELNMASEELLEKYRKLESENFKLREIIKNQEWSKHGLVKDPVWHIPEEIHVDEVHVELKLINGGTEQKIVIH